MPIKRRGRKRKIKPEQVETSESKIEADSAVQKQENNTKEEPNTSVDDELIESKEEIFASVHNLSKTAKQAFRLLKNKCKGKY